MNTSKTLLLVSSDALFAECASRFFRRHGWVVVGTASDGLQALAMTARLKPSRVLLVGEVPRLSTTALVRRLGRRSPASHVLILGVDAPASGVIEATADGNTVLARLNAPPADQVEEGSPRRDVDALRSLTPREVQVLRLLAAGSNRGEIARQLGVRPNTVRTHTQNLYSKLGLHNSVEVVGFAAAHGLMSELTGTDAGSSPTPASTRRSRDGRSAVNPRQRTG